MMTKSESERCESRELDETSGVSREIKSGWAEGDGPAHRPDCGHAASTLRAHDEEVRARGAEQCHLLPDSSRLDLVVVKGEPRSARRKSNFAFSVGGYGNGLAADEWTRPTKSRPSCDSSTETLGVLLARLEKKWG